MDDELRQRLRVSSDEWAQGMAALPIGTVTRGRVIGIEPFGVFVDVGLRPVGLIEIVITHPSPGTRLLPCDSQLWPKLGDSILVRIMGFRGDREFAFEWIP